LHGVDGNFSTNTKTICVIISVGGREGGGVAARLKNYCGTSAHPPLVRGTRTRLSRNYKECSINVTVGGFIAGSFAKRNFQVSRLRLASPTMIVYFKIRFPFL
jgi:hypothetical protein